MTVRPFLHLPPPAPSLDPSQMAAYMRRLWDALYQARRGKLECVTELTLTANTTTTTLSYKGLSPQSAVYLDPKTANAAAAIGAGAVYALTADRGNDSWVFTHANNAQTDREFQVCVIG